MKVSELKELKKGDIVFWFSAVTPYPAGLTHEKFLSMSYHGESFIDVITYSGSIKNNARHILCIEDDGSIELFTTKIEALEYQLKETVDNIIRPIRHQIRKLRGEKKVNLTKEIVYAAFELFNIDMKSDSYDGDEDICPPLGDECCCVWEPDNIPDCSRCISDFLNKRLAENV